MFGPTGTIISYMGNKAPDGYLPCNGGTYSISDYNNLAEQIKKEFGSYSYWGGDGETTFALPDLRGEFLRGTGTSSRGVGANGGAGQNVGLHQDPTQLSSGYMTSDNGNLYLPYNDRKQYIMSNYDSADETSTGTSVFYPGDTEGNTYRGVTGMFTVRPTNTAVLYCIKY